MLLSTSFAFSQSGGTYLLEKSVISNGGDTIAGGTYAMTGTIGQPSAGVVSVGGSFLMMSGFWTPQVGPTSAPVSISGRVMTPSGRGINNAALTLVSMEGRAVVVRTGGFGYFRFNDLSAGDTYILSVKAKSFTFAQSPVTLFLGDHIADLEFISNEP